MHPSTRTARGYGRVDHIQPRHALHQGLHPALLPPIPLGQGLPDLGVLCNVHQCGILARSSLLFRLSLQPHGALLELQHPGLVHQLRVGLCGDGWSQRGRRYRRPATAYMAVEGSPDGAAAEDSLGPPFHDWGVVSPTHVGVFCSFAADNGKRLCRERRPAEQYSEQPSGPRLYMARILGQPSMVVGAPPHARHVVFS